MIARIAGQARSLVRSGSPSFCGQAAGRRRTSPTPPTPLPLLLPLGLAILLAGLLVLLQVSQVLSSRSPDLPYVAIHSSPFDRWLDPDLADRPEDLAFARTCGQAGLLTSGAGHGPSPIGGLPFGGELRKAAAKGALSLRPDGLIRVSPPEADVASSTSTATGDERFHPVLRLMADAERSLAIRLSEQSTTFELAVAHYRKRYKREPPPGFDRWCVPLSRDRKPDIVVSHEGESCCDLLLTQSMSAITQVGLRQRA